MKKSLITIAVITLYIALLGGTDAFFLTPADLSPLLSPSQKTGWFPLINLSHNAFLNWKLDSYISSAANLFGNTPADFSACICWIAATIFGIGMWILCSLVSTEKSIFPGLSLGLLTTLMCLALWGGDTVVLTTIAWLPWLTLALIAFITTPKNGLFYLLITLFFLLRVISSANCMALSVVIIAAITARSFISEAEEFSPFFWISTGICILITCTALFFMPGPDWPDYPELAHVITNNGLTGMVRPLVGPSPPIPVIDRGFVQEKYRLISLILMLFTMIALIAHKSDRRSRSLLASAFILSLLTVLDTALPEQIAHVMPLAVLSRLVPEWVYFPVTPFCIAGACFLLAVHDAVKETVLSSGLSVLIVAPLILAIPSQDPTFPLLQDKTDASFLQSYRAFSEESPDSLDIFKHVISPSLNIFKREGFWMLKKPELLREIRKEKIRYRLPARSVCKYNTEIKTSHNQAEASLMIDGKSDTRWSRGGGRQEGNEWIHIKFDNPVTIQGVEPFISPRFLADFPRGIRVSFSAECSSVSSFTDYTVTTEIRQWEGPLRLTQEGHLFHGGQTTAEIIFPEKVTARCFLIEQIGKSERIDWSVSRLRFLFLDEEHCISPSESEEPL